jgi:phenacrylate decarboxylase
MVGLLACQDFRQYVHELVAEGDATIIKAEVDPADEVGAIVRRVYETRSPAPLFENIKGRKGNGLFRILGAPVGVSKQPGYELRRLAKSLGLPSTASGLDVIHKLVEAREAPPIPPKVVETGPIKANRLKGDEIDLHSLPVPQLHQHDGGKYLQTFGMYVVQSPDGSWTNWSVTRSHVHGKRELVGIVAPGQDIGKIHKMWKDIGKDTPFALCMGVPPAAVLAAGMPIPDFVDEAGYIGRLCGRPVEVAKCESNNLYVPANAEIVFEGTISATAMDLEGPMAEFHGHLFYEDREQQPIFTINTITYRDDPILPVVAAGKAPEETQTVWATVEAAEVFVACREAKLPVSMVWSPFESQALWFVLQIDRAKLVERRTDMKQFCLDVGEVVFGSKVGRWIPKVLLVGDDVDPTDLGAVVMKEATCSEPGRSEYVFQKHFNNTKMVPYTGHIQRPQATLPSKVVRCCLLPIEFKQAKVPWELASFKHAYAESTQKKVLDRWTEYGFQ